MFIFPILNSPLSPQAAAEQPQMMAAPPAAAAATKASAAAADHYPPPGRDVELVRLQDAQLYLVDSQESVLMQQGEFRLVLTRQLHSPLAAVLAVVKDVEWPVGEDCPVLRLHRCGFIFCLPGVAYGLLLPDSTSNQAIDKLELSLRQYSSYDSRKAAADGPRNWSCDEQAALAYWNNVAAVVGWAGGTSTSGSVSGKKTPAGEVSPRMMKRVQQARRLSAVSKLFSRALLKGRICNAHVKALSSSLRARDRPANLNEAVASVDAFSKVVEAVEHSNRSSLQRSQLDPASKPSSEGKNTMAVGNAWTLNELGLQLLIAAVAASTVLHFSPPKQVSVPVRAAPVACPLPGATKLSGCGFRPVLARHRP